MKVRRSTAKEERAFVKHKRLPGIKGHGPRHADAVHNTDTVPAMLTPREAVLNRNAAELAGRGNIEALNARGNKLARKGVDLAAEGDSDVDERDLGPMLDKWTSGLSAQELKVLGPLFDEFLRHREVASKMKVSDLRPDLLENRRHAADTLPAFSAEPQYTQDSPALEGAARWRLPGYEKGTSNMKKQKLAEGGYAGDWQGGPAKRKQPGYAGDWQGGPLGRPEMQRPAPQGGMDAILAGRPNFTATQWYNPAQGAWQARRPQETPFAGGAPPNPGVPPGGMPPAYGGGGGLPNNFGVGGGFYPPEQGPFAQNKVFRGQAGTTEVQPIGTPAGGQVYGPPIQLSAPDILSKLQAAGKEQGLSSAQINGLMNAFKGGSQAFNQGGGMGPTTDVSGGYYGLSQSPGGYQGGISDIGYPPFVAPNADYHGDKGGWQGRYDPNYFIPNYG